MSDADVLIVGGGPAGLHAALELKRRYGLAPLILEREAEPGGVPRWCDHYTFFCRVKRRLFRGPVYASLWAKQALDAAIPILTETTVLRLRPADVAVDITSPRGPATLCGKAILLATGARESHRHQRLAAGDRVPGVFTTASLFQFLYRSHSMPAKRFVVFGSEDVSYSCVRSILKAGGQVAAVVEETGGTRSFDAVRWYFERVSRISHFFAIDDFAIYGHRSVEHVSFLDRAGRLTTIRCDGVVFTGGFLPNAELVRSGELLWNPASRGPAINQAMQTSAPAVFAAGNCLRGVVSADEAGAEGRAAAAAIAWWLEGKPANIPEVPLRTAGSIGYCCPDRLLLANVPGLHRVSFWPNDHLRRMELSLDQTGRTVWKATFGRIQPGRRLHVPLSGLADSLTPNEPVTASLRKS